MQGGRVVTTEPQRRVNGGITNGMPVVLRTVVKPTPSIYKVQQTVDYAAKRNATLRINAGTTRASCTGPDWCRTTWCVRSGGPVRSSSAMAWQEGSSWNTD